MPSRCAARLFVVAIALAAPALAEISPAGAWTKIDLAEDERVGWALLAADFDADGSSDLAFSAYNQTYGNVRFHRNVDGQLVPIGTISGAAGNDCGKALAAGRFASQSARPRIAVGCPNDWHKGSVRIYRIPPSNDQVTLVRTLAPGVDGMVGASVDEDLFGWSLAVGDFDGDGADDLAIGSPGFASTGNTWTGAVYAVYGDSSGLDPARSQRWTQNSSGVPDSSEPYDGFGTALASGDFDGDGFDDVAIGTPNEGVSGQTNAGAVTVLYGSPLGLATSGAGSHPAQWLTQGDGIVPGIPEWHDEFGETLATGKIVSDDGGGPADDEDDLVIGASDEEYNGEAAAGVVFLLVGRSGGFTGAGATLLSQAPLEGAVESGDQFGAALAVADFTGDAWDDIAVASPWESLSGSSFDGVVHIVPGGAGGLDLAGGQLLAPDASYPLAPARQFGDSLAGADFNGDGHADLAVGSPWWHYVFPDPDIVRAGNVMVLFNEP